MSTQKGFEGWGPRCTTCRGYHPDQHGDECLTPGCTGDRTTRGPGDEKLLAFLWKNAHATPFEMAGCIVEVQAPIFVFREWHRHRTQSYNEASARYAPLPAFDYVPEIDRVLLGGGHLTKQAAAQDDATVLDESKAQRWRKRLAIFYRDAELLYQDGLADGVPKELARLCLPVGRYSKMRASANLRNWLGFLVLRNDPKAQWEIRMYAQALEDLLTERFPRTLALFREGRSR